MATTDFYKDFGFVEAYDVHADYDMPELEEIRYLGVDKVYFSGEYPAIFFKEVARFDEAALKEIARIHHLAWNFRRVTFLFAVSPVEIRIYNCGKKPFNYEAPNVDIYQQAQRLEVTGALRKDKLAWNTIRQLFSRVAVDAGVFWSRENELRSKMDIQQRIDKYLVKSLLSAAKELKGRGLDNDVIHSLLMRSIFIMYLEDKGAANETKLYAEIARDAQSYLDILLNKHSTYTLFKKVGEHFNGNVFPILRGEERKVNVQDLHVIRRCLTDGDLSANPKLFEWRLFRFDIIQIELLSEIYENFLEEFKTISKEEAGQYYTPPSLVELILNQKLKFKNETNWNVKVLDPACGSGIFLVESFKRLVKRWKNANPGKPIEFKDLREIIKANIFGIELDKYAIRVAAFSLYLAIVEQLNPKTLWVDKRYKFPYLIFDPQDASLENQGNNLFRADTIGEIDPLQFPKFDLVVGNPPFGANIKLPSIRKFLDAYGYGKDLVIPFLRKAVEFTDDGVIALIFNSKVLTNTEGPFQKFREWLLKETYVEKIYNLSIFRKAPKTFGGQLFTSAVGPVSIVFYQKKQPKIPSPVIEYWAPKTYVKNSLIEGVVIDATDIKYLPREECQKPDTKIWKIAMWGTLEDFKLIERLNALPRLGEFLKAQKINKATGMEFLSKSTVDPVIDKEVSRLPYILPERIQRYLTSPVQFGKLVDGPTDETLIQYRKYYKIKPTDRLQRIDAFRRLSKEAKKAFEGPHLLMKEGLIDKKLGASYVEESCSFSKTVLGINAGSKEILKALTCYLNSKLATYYLFLISSSIGIERERVKPNELYELPFYFDNDFATLLSEYLDSMQVAINDSYPFEADTRSIELAINNTIDDMLQLSENDRALISDFVDYTIDLMLEGDSSVALRATTEPESVRYATIVCNELNQFLDATLYVNAEVYEVTRFQPLNLIKLTLGETKKEIQSGNSGTFIDSLSFVDRCLLTKEANNIYIKRQLKYYDGNCIYIVKPNQKRFWSRSMAINDAKELIAEILNMKQPA